MGQMKELWEDINYLLDTTHLLCADIAEELGCPVEWVNEVVEQRWNRILSPEDMSPYSTVNS